jgi:6-phosphogluconolactonase/glucosamine-6-phosphate isomerase/deaminase
MEIIRCKEQTEWVEAINVWILNRIQSCKAKSIFIPAGETPRPLYASWETNKPPFDKHMQLLQVDEILTGNQKFKFKKFFSENLPTYISQVQLISEADKIADLAILGLGVNGHVAFHEPGLNVGFFSGCLTLDQITLKNLNLEFDTKVISYGLASFIRAKSIALIVRGEAKKSILRKVLEPGSKLPAAYLLRHPDLQIFTDFGLD